MKYLLIITVQVILFLPNLCVIAQNNSNKYSANPNHRELTLKAFQLAVSAGFKDNNISNQEIQNRLEAGAYSEDYENIPGIIGNHYPDPWSQGSTFNFAGLYPITRIPYGKLTSTNSGWSRTLMHGFDPVQGFLWPGASETTLDWANSIYNSYTWDKAIALYNNGEWEKAYQCLGHVLHLLADLSVPAHVKIVDHGGSLKSKNSGTLLDPDIGRLVVDEYERALNGGLELSQYPGIFFIPDLLSDFQSSLDSTDTTYVPDFSNWHSYLDSLARYTYNHPIVNLYYSAPDSNGLFGRALDTTGTIVHPIKYGITFPPAEIDGRWTQFEVFCTVDINNLSVIPVIPKRDMKKMCYDLVPKAVEFAAGLILHFRNTLTGITKLQDIPKFYKLKQNYPNPFNPTTIIEFELPKVEKVKIEVYNSLGQKVAILLNKTLPFGNHKIEFNAHNLTSGIYFYIINTGSYTSVKKMMLVK